MNSKLNWTERPGGFFIEMSELPKQPGTNLPALPLCPNCGTTHSFNLRTVRNDKQEITHWVGFCDRTRWLASITIFND